MNQINRKDTELTVCPKENSDHVTESKKKKNRLGRRRKVVENDCLCT